MHDPEETPSGALAAERIDYLAILADAATTDHDALQSYLFEELPYAWLRAYKATCSHPANVYQIDVDGFEYLFDFTTELVNRGDLDASRAIEDRVVAVHGRSRPPQEGRKDGIMRSQPLGPIEFVTPVLRGRYDRGHFIAHSIGSDQLHINIFPQVAEVNRGWSDVGSVYRDMERYCAAHPDTYCFSRPIYSGLSAHPYAVEFGVLRHDGSLWVNLFPNCTSSEEMDEIERLLGEKLAAQQGDH